MITHLLDTSALLAHNQNEPGAAQVTALLALGPGAVAISALTLIELKGRLRELIPDPAEVERLFHAYTSTLTRTLPVTAEIALMAITLREQHRPRVPLVDSVIAATAKAHNVILVHRDPHLTVIPTTEVPQIVLPQKG